MQFWKVQSPDYESDYDSHYVNGDIDHPFGMPGLKCERCGTLWSGLRVLPIECPERLRTDPRLTVGSPISLADFNQLDSEIRTASSSHARLPSKLKPGDAFQPCFLDIPTFPKADFLWCSLGSVVVSNRVKDLLTSEKIDSVAFSRVTPRKVGQRLAEFPAPMPETGEPEDIIREVPLVEDLDSVPPYFELIALVESLRPRGREPISTCRDCGYERFDGAVQEFGMSPEMWTGHQLFQMATTLHLIATDRLKRLLENAGFTNVQFARAGAP